MAAQRLTFPRVSTPYGNPADDDRLARDVAGDAETNQSPLRSYLEARTRFFDTVVVQSIEAGFSQIVIGAAGYDGRAWRYAKPGVRWYEVDHPSTQSDKLGRLESLGIATEHVRFVAADFTDNPVAERLEETGFSTTERALFTLEGVAVYLERSTLESVLTEFRSLAAKGSLLAISLSVSTGSSGRKERRQQFQAAVARLGEPARTVIEDDEVDSLLSATGWQPRGEADEGDARRRAAGLIVATTN